MPLKDKIGDIYQRYAREQESIGAYVDPNDLYGLLFHGYSQKALAELLRVLTESGDEIHLKDTLKAYLRDNWTFIKGSVLSYTSIASHPVTQLMIELSVLLQNEAESALCLLMPGVSVESMNPVKYPDLDQKDYTTDALSKVCLTHVLSEDAYSLIPISTLINESLDRPELQLPNVYFDLFFYSGENASSDVIQSKTRLNDDEIRRLWGHSGLTRQLYDTRTYYLQAVNDSNNLLSHLEHLLQALYFNSVNVAGKELESGVHIFSASEAFFSFWERLAVDEKKKIPAKLVEEIALLKRYFDGEKRDIGSCFATRYDVLKAAMRGHEESLAKIGLDDARKQEALLSAKHAFERAIDELTQSLSGLGESYNGRDDLGLTCSLLDAFNIRLELRTKVQAFNVIEMLAPNDMPIIFKTPEIRAQFLSHMHSFDDWANLVFGISPTKLKGVFEGIGREEISRGLCDDWTLFFRLYDMLEAGKQSVLLDSVYLDGEALILASKWGRLEIVQSLIQAQVNLNIKGEGGGTALIKAAKFGESEIVNLLIRAGANPELQDEEGDTALIYAIRANNPSQEIVQSLIQAQVNLNIKGEGGRTALITAAEFGESKIVDALIRAGASINVTDNIGNTALLWAIQHKHTQVAINLIRSGADISIKNHREENALIIASRLGDIEVVRALLEKECPLNEVDDHGLTALLNAIFNGHMAVVNALLQAGVDPDLQDKEGDTALIGAIRANNPSQEIVQSLIQAQVNLNIKGEDGRTALITAAEFGESKIVDALIRAGASINVTDNIGNTALLWAIQHKHTQVAINLIRSGADISIKNHREENALIIASRLGDIEVVRALLEKECPLNEVDDHGLTALLNAIFNGHMAVVNALLQAGVDPDLQDKEGDTALIGAIRANNPSQEIVQSLIQAQVNLNIKGEDGRTALINAARFGEREIVDALIRAGASINVTDNNGNTALLSAIRHKHTQVAINLIRSGADISIKNHREENALIIASRKGDIEVVRALLEKGCPLNEIDEDGDTALYVAIIHNKLDVAKRLIESGTDLSLKNKRGKDAMAMAKEYSRKLLPLIKDKIKENFSKQRDLLPPVASRRGFFDDNSEIPTSKRADVDEKKPARKRPSTGFVPLHDDEYSPRALQRLA